MDHQAFALLERSLRRGQLDEIGKYLREPADFAVRFPDLEGVERSVVEILRAQGHCYMQLLERLVQLGLSPADPVVEATGLFRIGTILTSFEAEHCESEQLCTFLARMRALAPAAELRNHAGVHPLARALWSPRHDTTVLEWVLAELEGGLAELDAQRPILESCSYPHDHLVFMKLCVLLERGVNADWRDTPEYDENGEVYGRYGEAPAGALAWMLRDKPIPLHLLHLFIEHGARDENFLLDLVSSRDRKLGPQMPGLVRAYLGRASGRGDLDRARANGLTPLHIALLRREPALVAALVEGGASSERETTARATLHKIKVAKGTTPRALCEQLGDPQLAAALAGQREHTQAHHTALAAELGESSSIASAFDAMLAHFDALPGLRWQSRPQAIAAGASLTQLLRPSVIATIEALWPKRSPAHLALLRVGLLLGGRTVSWSLRERDDTGPTLAMGGFELASWGEMIGSGLLCRHEDTGRTYFKISKAGVKLRFIATYEEGKAFTLKLDLDTFIERLLRLGGLHYFPYFSFPRRAPYIARLPDFDASLDAIERADIVL